MSERTVHRRSLAGALLRGAGLTTLSVVLVLLFTGTGASASQASGPGQAPTTLPLFALGGLALVLLVVAHLVRRPLADLEIVSVGD